MFSSTFRLHCEGTSTFLFFSFFLHVDRPVRNPLALTWCRLEAQPPPPLCAHISYGVRTARASRSREPSPRLFMCSTSLGAIKPFATSHVLYRVIKRVGVKMETRLALMASVTWLTAAGGAAAATYIINLLLLCQRCALARCDENVRDTPSCTALDNQTAIYSFQWRHQHQVIFNNKNKNYL